MFRCAALLLASFTFSVSAFAQSISAYIATASTSKFAAQGSSGASARSFSGLWAGTLALKGSTCNEGSVPSSFTTFFEIIQKRSGKVSVLPLGSPPALKGKVLKGALSAEISRQTSADISQRDALSMALQRNGTAKTSLKFLVRNRLSGASCTALFKGRFSR